MWATLDSGKTKTADVREAHPRLAFPSLECVRAWNSPWSCGSRAGLVLASHYPPGEGLHLIITLTMGKVVTFHAPHTPSSCSRRTVIAWSSLKLHTLSEARTQACRVTGRNVSTELPSSVCMWMCICVRACVFTIHPTCHHPMSVTPLLTFITPSQDTYVQHTQVMLPGKWTATKTILANLS